MSGTCSSLRAIARLAASLGSARRFAARTSHGSIIAVVSVPRLTVGPKRKPKVSRSSIASRHSMSVSTSAVRRSGSTDRTSEPFYSRWAPLQRLLVDGELAFDAVYRTVEQVDG